MGRHIARKRIQLTKRRPAVLTKEASDFVRHALGAREDENLVLGFLVLHDLLKVLDHLVALLALGHDLDNLGDAMVGSEIHGADVDLNEVGLEVGSQGADLLGPGGGPHACLAVGPDLADDLADLGLETHVKHAVGLVENEICDAAQVRLTRLEHVDQATRGGNTHLDAALKIPNLGPLGDTAIDASVANPGRLAELCDFLLNLDSQLTSGCEDQDNGAVAGSKEGLGVDVDDGREAVGQGLARAGLGDTDNIASRERHGPALRLNGSRRGETLGLHLVHDVAREASLVEGLDGLRNVVTGNGDGVIATELLDLGRRAAADVGMLLVERLLKLGKRVQVPVLLLQAGAEVGHTITTAATEAAAAAAISTTASVAATTTTVTTTAAAGITIRATVEEIKVSKLAFKR